MREKIQKLLKNIAEKTHIKTKSSIEKTENRNYFEAFKSRRSIRKYLDEPVPWETIYNIVESSCNAPCAGNVQNYKIIIIKDHKAKEEIGKIQTQQYWISEASYLIAVVRDNEKLKTLYPQKGETYAIQNCAAVIENILMLAHLEGLGACWVEACDNEVLKEYLGVSGDKVVDAIIPISYPNENPSVPKTPMSEIIRFEKFGNRKSN